MFVPVFFMLIAQGVIKELRPSRGQGGYDERFPVKQDANADANILAKLQGNVWKMDMYHLLTDNRHGLGTISKYEIALQVLKMYEDRDNARQMPYHSVFLQEEDMFHDL